MTQTVSSQHTLHHRLCNAQDSKFRMLAALGIAAVGCTTTSSFTQSDADRFTALTHLTPSVPESLDPILLPPSRPAPAPLGPIAYNTLPAQQHPSSGSLQMDRQRSSSQAAAGNTTSTGSRGRPAKEPKLSGMQAQDSVYSRHQSRFVSGEAQAAVNCHLFM